jgi:hypothetical protein
MIVYELCCTQGHRFEGWFASADDFVRQSTAAMVRCPVCDDASVAVVPSAKVQVGRHAEVPVRPAPGTAEGAMQGGPAAGDAAMGLPAELVRKLRAIVKATEDVGSRFPDEARKIHYEEIPARAIRGQATREEAAELKDEGIDFAALPAFLTRDPN